jgi:hypothetical protein
MTLAEIARWQEAAIVALILTNALSLLVAAVAISIVRLEHDPEKWIPVFGKRSCSNNKPERDDGSKKNRPALGTGELPPAIARLIDRIGGLR